MPATAGMTEPFALVLRSTEASPVIASAVGGIPELLGVDRGTILPQVTASSVAAALKAFVANRTEADAAAVRLRRHVLESYDVDRNASKLLDCYRSAIDHG